MAGRAKAMLAALQIEHELGTRRLSQAETEPYSLIETGDGDGSDDDTL